MYIHTYDADGASLTVSDERGNIAPLGQLPSDPGDWKRETLDLSAYAGRANLEIVFRNQGGPGAFTRTINNLMVGFAERGEGAFDRTLEGMRWLAANGVRMSAAGRTMWGEDEAAAREPAGPVPGGQWFSACP